MDSIHAGWSGPCLFKCAYYYLCHEKIGSKMSLIRELDDIVKAERLLKRYNDKFARFNRRKVSYVDWLK